MMKSLENQGFRGGYRYTIVTRAVCAER